MINDRMCFRSLLQSEAWGCRTNMCGALFQLVKFIIHLLFIYRFYSIIWSYIYGDNLESLLLHNNDVGVESHIIINNVAKLYRKSS